MAMTNAERQAAFRARRRAARPARAAVVDDGEGMWEQLFRLMRERWTEGALRLLDHRREGAPSCLTFDAMCDAIRPQVRDHDVRLVDMLAMAESAGQAWALDKLTSAHLASEAERHAAEATAAAAAPAPGRRRRRNAA